jgi:serine/threonine protein kinase
VTLMLAPGTRLGSYQVLAPLGAGGMGEVYRAHDTTLGRAWRSKSCRRPSPPIPIA